MNMNEYQSIARSTAVYPKEQALAYLALGLGESGEVQNKVKKIIRDKGGEWDGEDAYEIVKELGDILWYVANMAYELGVDLFDVAQVNIDKLNSRAARGVLQGSGDNR